LVFGRLGRVYLHTTYWWTVAFNFPKCDVSRASDGAPGRALAFVSRFLDGDGLPEPIGRRAAARIGQNAPALG
jgi:hypothetical protein